jgi:hypothetical protein
MLVAAAVGTAIAVTGSPIPQPVLARPAAPTASVSPSTGPAPSLPASAPPEAPASPEALEPPDASGPFLAPEPPRAIKPPVAHEVTADSDRAVPPEECADLYGAAMFDMLSAEPALPLNDGTTLEPPFSRSPEVAALQNSPALTCTWGSAGDFGLLTQVNEVDAPQAVAAENALRAVGFSCSEQSDGTRCVVKHASGDVQWGETHFLRGNIWLCTYWLNIAVKGYTDDMVASLWG